MSREFSITLDILRKIFVNNELDINNLKITSEVLPFVSKADLTEPYSNNTIVSSVNLQNYFKEYTEDLIPNVSSLEIYWNNIKNKPSDFFLLNIHMIIIPLLFY